MDATTYARAVEEHRRRKDDAFRTAPWSPIPHAKRKAFPGLAYFPPDPRWRFEVPLERDAEAPSLEMQTSAGEVRRYRRVGRFRLATPAGEAALSAYLPEGGDHLFVPFRDATSGKATYGAGRYLDLPWLGPEATYEVDLNDAYNPYCAYDEAYSCPFPPPENWLKVAVEAGERYV